MPATSSRMSSSSSTIRISDAITDLFSFSVFSCSGFAAGGVACLPHRQDYRNHGAAPFEEIGRSVVQFEHAAMVLDDLLDDRQAKAGALFARRHIGLEQPLAILARQTLAIVDDIDADLAVLDAGDDANDAGLPVLALDGLDGFGAILDDIADRLAHQPAVECALQRLGPKTALEGDVGAADLDQE